MFNELCWHLNKISPDFVAKLRQITARVLPTQEKSYNLDPQATGGWLGWVECPIGCLAFRSADTNELVWRW